MTGEVKTAIRSMLEGNSAMMSKMLKKLEDSPKEWLLIYEKFCAYVIPKQQFIEIADPLEAMPFEQKIKILAELQKRIPPELIETISSDNGNRNGSG